METYKVSGLPGGTKIISAHTLYLVVGGGWWWWWGGGGGIGRKQQYSVDFIQTLFLYIYTACISIILNMSWPLSQNI